MSSAKAQAKYNARTRPLEAEGVYLAAMKMEAGDFLLKVGETQQARSRAGNMAGDARKKHGLRVQWAEILYIIETETGQHEDRMELEALVLAEAQPIVGDEFFSASDYDRFSVMRWQGQPYMERTTSAARRQEFLEWYELNFSELLRNR